MGAVLSTMLLIGAMQNCASEYDDDNVLKLYYKCTLEKSDEDYYKYIDENEKYGIEYRFDDVHYILICIWNDALKNYQLDNIMVNNIDMHNLVVMESKYDYYGNCFVIYVYTKTDPTKNVTVKLRFVKTNI